LVKAAWERIFSVARSPFTIAQQIRGLEKALRNKKTPGQFRAGMKKRLAKLTAQR
jgi:hypothetical protein